MQMVVVLESHSKAAVRREALRRGDGSMIRVTVEQDDWAPHLDADQLAKLVADGIARVHVDAILEGRKADGSGQQPGLIGGQGRRAEQGKRPDIRGVTEKADFPRSIKAYGSGSAATVKARKRPPKGKRALKALFKEVARQAKIRKRQESGKGFAFVQPGGQHQPWLSRELDRGVEYFYVDGDVEKEIELVLEAFVEASVE